MNYYKRAVTLCLSSETPAVFDQTTAIRPSMTVNGQIVHLNYRRENIMQKIGLCLATKSVNFIVSALQARLECSLLLHKFIVHRTHFLTQRKRKKY
jgi:hypothetical protein